MLYIHVSIPYTIVFLMFIYKYIPSNVTHGGGIVVPRESYIATSLARIRMHVLLISQDNHEHDNLRMVG